MAAGNGRNPTAVHVDDRGDDRALRVTWHLSRSVGGRDADGQPDPLVVLSLWRGNVCSGTFRLRREEVSGLIAFLADGLDVVERREVAAGLAEAAAASDEGTVELPGSIGRVSIGRVTPTRADGGSELRCAGGR